MKKVNDAYLRQCLSLASQMRGKSFPNPLVGCVIVNNNKIVGQGVHQGLGLPHAETIALKQAGKKTQGATLYVNLEPCCHHGNTPPCTEAIIKAKIKKVVFAIKDPNPLVNKGNSQKKLENAGIEVIIGTLEEEAKKLNELFLKFHNTGKPFVSLKLAASLDGKIATTTGESKWITGEQARQYGQLLRKEADSILVGVNTIITDNPELTIRDNHKQIRQPLRIILDSKLRIPLKAKVLNMKAKGATLVITTKKASKQKIKIIQNKGIEVLTLKNTSTGKVDFKDVIRQLSKRQITSLLIEGGGEIAASAIASKIVDKLYYFIAPIIIGGKDSIPAVGGPGISKLKNAYNLKDISFEKIGTDFLVQGYF